MEKILNIISLVLKLATVSVGGLTATDAAVLSLDAHTLGAIVSGLGSASLGVKWLQTKFALKASTTPPKYN